MTDSTDDETQPSYDEDQPAANGVHGEEEPPRAEEVVDDEDLTLPGSLESIEGSPASPDPEDPGDPRPGPAR